MNDSYSCLILVPFFHFKERKGEEIVDPNLTLKDLKNGQHITRIKVSSLYLLMGRELQALHEVPAGNVLGLYFRPAFFILFMYF